MDMVKKHIGCIPDNGAFMPVNDTCSFAQQFQINVSVGDLDVNLQQMPELKNHPELPKMQGKMVCNVLPKMLLRGCPHIWECFVK